jgi:hypothetical protein
MAELHLRTKLWINNIPFDLEITHVDASVITGFTFDGRIFRETRFVSDSETIHSDITKQSETNRIPTVKIKIPPGVTLEKVCSHCKKSKPLDAFHKSQTDSFGRQNTCKECNSIYNKEYKKAKKKSVTVNPDPITLPGKKPAFVPKKNIDWNKDRDKVLRDNFDELSVSGIFDKSLLPGFSMTDIRTRCMELSLIDEYGNPVQK